MWRGGYPPLPSPVSVLSEGKFDSYLPFNETQKLSRVSSWKSLSHCADFAKRVSPRIGRENCRLLSLRARLLTAAARETRVLAMRTATSRGHVRCARSARGDWLRRRVTKFLHSLQLCLSVFPIFLLSLETRCRLSLGLTASLLVGGCWPYGCPAVWNSLLFHLRHASSLSAPKQRLQTHLFGCACDWWYVLVGQIIISCYDILQTDKLFTILQSSRDEQCVMLCETCYDVWRRYNHMRISKEMNVYCGLRCSFVHLSLLFHIGHLPTTLY